MVPSALIVFINRIEVLQYYFTNNSKLYINGLQITMSMMSNIQASTLHTLAITSLYPPPPHNQRSPNGLEHVFLIY